MRHIQLSALQERGAAMRAPDASRTTHVAALYPGGSDPWAPRGRPRSSPAAGGAPPPRRHQKITLPRSSKAAPRLGGSMRKLQPASISPPALLPSRTQPESARRAHRAPAAHAVAVLDAEAHEHGGLAPQARHPSRGCRSCPGARRCRRR